MHNVSVRKCNAHPKPLGSHLGFMFPSRKIKFKTTVSSETWSQKRDNKSIIVASYDNEIGVIRR